MAVIEWSSLSETGPQAWASIFWPWIDDWAFCDQTGLEFHQFGMRLTKRASGQSQNVQAPLLVNCTLSWFQIGWPKMVIGPWSSKWAKGPRSRLRRNDACVFILTKKCYLGSNSAQFLFKTLYSSLIRLKTAITNKNLQSTPRLPISSPNLHFLFFFFSSPS